MADPLSTAPSTASHSESPPPAPAAATAKRDQRAPRGIRRRNRIITSCLECRRRKLKCDKQQPCNNCTRFSTSCVFITHSTDPQAQAKLTEVKEKMGMLERTLEEGVSKTKKNSKRLTNSPPASYEAPLVPGQDLDSNEEEEDDDDNFRPVNQMGVPDVTYYEDDDDDNDDIFDLGIAIGKIRLTERIGGLVRPSFAGELKTQLESVDETESSNSYAGRPQSSWMSPGSEFVVPTSSFFFAPGMERTSLMTYLPSKTLVDKLMANYWEVVDLISHIVHRPSFERDYEVFWLHVASGTEPRKSFQAVLFAALLASIISMSNEKVLLEFGVERQPLLDNFQQGAEAALAKANFMRSTKLETLQALVMYLIPLCRAEVSRAHSALAGTCIRLAQCMGLHRDPASYSKNPIEIQTRRLIWFHIGFLDIRTCEATGPHPQIRRDEFDTKFPLNIDDDALQSAMQNGEHVLEDSKSFTDMTITKMRFECYEMFRILWIERPKMQRPVEEGEKKTTVTGLLSRIQAFKAAMEKTYLPMMCKTNPQHAVAVEMYNILSTRMYVMILHIFERQDGEMMPARLRDIMISACIMVIEHNMKIDQEPALKKWAWYVGALHQYHTALLFISEMWRPSVSVQTPAELARIDRMWRCIDYSFELPPHLSRLEKKHLILREMFDRTSTYTTLRRVRVPIDTERRPIPGDSASEKKPSKHSRPERSVERDPSPAAQSSSSGYAKETSPPNQQKLGPQNQWPPQYQQYVRPSVPPIGPLGSMPQTDWGSFDMATANLQPQPPQHGINASYEFGDLGTNPPMAQAPDLYYAPDVGTTTDISASPMANSLGGSEGSGQVPNSMAAAMDIDWAEWEQLFAGAEMGAGDLLIPPFTFPSFEPSQFEPSETQWPNTGGL